MFEIKFTFERNTKEGKDIIFLNFNNHDIKKKNNRQILITNTTKRLSQPMAKLFLSELEKHINVGINDFYLENMPQE